MPYITARYSDPRRYLVKTLRETGGRIGRLVLGFGEAVVRVHRSCGGWSAGALMGCLREAERVLINMSGRRASRGQKPIVYGLDSWREWIATLPQEQENH